MDRWKSRGAKSQTGAESEGRKVRKEKIRRKKMQVCEKVGKSRNTFFSMFCGSGGSKSRLAKVAGAETSGETRNEKLHAVVARSRFWSEKVQNTWVSEHFWKLRCPKSARRCGAKHISKSTCTKHTRSGPLLAVEMSKKCTPLWREAHFEVKMYKTHQVRTTFGSWDVEKVHAVVARSTFRSENVQNTTCSRHFWRFRCRFAWQAQGIVHLFKSEQNVRVFVAFPKTMAGMGHLKRICKDAFSVAGAVQRTCSWEMLGQGADFLRGVAFWSIRCAGLLRWFCVTGAALRMIWHQFSVAGAIL